MDDLRQRIADEVAKTIAANSDTLVAKFLERYPMYPIQNIEIIQEVRPHGMAVYLSLKTPIS